MPLRLPSFEAIVLSSVLAILAALVSWLNAPVVLNNVFHDAFQRAALGQAPEDIVIIGVDEASLKGIGKWPWRRDIHAQLIDRLREAEVRAIAYDIVFAERDTPYPEYDAQLVEAVKRYGNLVLPVYVGHNKPGGQLLEIIPFDELASAASLAHAHVEIDPDGVLRSTHLKEGLGTPYWEHLTLTLHRLAYGDVPEPLPGSRATTELTAAPGSLIARDYRNLIRFSAAPGGFRMLSFLDVLDGRFPQRALKDKIVFVGTMAAGMTDTLATPVSSERRHMQGVELNANIFQSLRTNTLITPMEAVTRALWTGVLTFCSLLLITNAAPAFSLLITIVLAINVVAISFAALTIGNIWWPPAACFIAIMIGYPLWSWRRLDRSMSYLRHELLSLKQESDLPDRELLEDQLMPWDNSAAVVPKRNVDVVSFHIEQIQRSHASRRQLRHFIFSCLANLSDGVVATSNTGRVVLINDQARKLLHQQTESAHAQTISSLLENNVDSKNLTQQKAINDTIDELYSEGKSAEIEYQTRHGSEILLQGNEFDLDDDDDEHSKIVVFTLTDITRLREMERTRAETLNFVSHDLRSPLVSILALIERGGQSPSEEMIDIRSYAQRALSYTESFLQLARAEADKLTLYECDLHSVADNAAEYLYTLATRRNIQILTEHCEEDVWIWGNGDLLERMIINLIDNAIKYSPEKSLIEVSIGTEIEQSSGSRIAVVSVKDYGIGVPEADLPHLFEQFRRGSSEESRTRKGAGLGLRFIYVTVQRHKGSVSVSSEQGIGSEFTIRLPLLDIDLA